ncbi:penicillin-binding transpeptidase domain-containing protein [Estrella lausannensis]|nr:penicillin-binding transpeptidase domain-containing protein [Estrella lausannensis]
MSYSSKENDIPGKANRVLNVVMFALALIATRLWYLAVIAHEDQVKAADRPKSRFVIEPARRASIRDRYNIPLAINKMRYQVSVVYGQIRSLSGSLYIIDKEGNRRRIKRREYIDRLSKMLASELNLDQKRVEDLIHSKASLLNQIPFVIKTDLTESEYYRLKAQESDWPGLEVAIIPKRVYPMGRVASDIIGYMGAISKQEYDRIVGEIKVLEAFIEETEHGLDAEVPKGFSTVEEARERLADLKEKSYTIHDAVGKSGIEGQFDQELRGFFGKKVYASDARGDFLREKSGGRDPISGQRLLLSISSELQAFAEELLIKNEMIRVPKLSETKKKGEVKEPWIKGGSIVAMDPNTGDILALATYPRFDPNDFISCSDPEESKEKSMAVQRWLETNSQIADLWDQKQPYRRERFDLTQGFVEEETVLDWPFFLSLVLPADNPVRQKLLTRIRFREAAALDSIAKELNSITGGLPFPSVINYLYQSSPHQPFGPKLGALGKIRIEERFGMNLKRVQEIREELNRLFEGIDLNYDKVLLADLSRLIVNSDCCSKELLKKLGDKSLTEVRNDSAALLKIVDHVKSETKKLFDELTFKEWREKEEKGYLKEMRLFEKENKKYPKPYLDYIDEMEHKLFDEFFARHKWQLVTAFLLGHSDFSYPEEGLQEYIEFFRKWHDEVLSGADHNADWQPSFVRLYGSLKKLELWLALEYMQSLRSYKDLERPLLGKLRFMRSKQPTEKDLAASFYPQYGYGYTRSYAYRQSTAQGSVFKLITAYAALAQRVKSLPEGPVSKKDLNPMEIVDQFTKKGKDEFVGFHQNGTPIPRYYKGGRLPRSIASNMGRVDLIRALEHSSNPYFALLAGDYLEDAEDLVNTARSFSYGERTGIELPFEIKGNLPDDTVDNRTSLYSLSIGQGSLVVTPLQTAVMLSAIANGGSVLVPNIVHLMVGDAPRRGADLLSSNEPYPFEDILRHLSVDFPLFTKAVAKKQKKEVRLFSKRLKREVFLPDEVKSMLFDGMNKVVERMHHFPTIGRLQAYFAKYPEAITALKILKGQLVGKTSTAETMERIDLDYSCGVNKYNHLWFGGISFEKGTSSKGSYLIQPQFGTPELVVVVYLRYGGYGRDTVPLAAQIVEKWREIKKRHEGK